MPRQTHAFPVLSALASLSRQIQTTNPFPYSPGFQIQTIASLAESLPSHSWEYGALEYAATKIQLGTGSRIDALAVGDGSAGDPAALGVAAVLLGKTDSAYADAAASTVNALMNEVPRFSNGAISHRVSIPELFHVHGPPIPRILRADQSDSTLLEQSVLQCALYREILQNSTSIPGAWMHIIGPESQDTGLWSSGNGWAAAGMTRVLATITKAPFSPHFHGTKWIKEILDAARAAPLNDSFSLLASVIYRMAVLQPDVFGAEYIAWADSIRFGIVTPADNTPFTSGSPEGQAFVVLMYAAWRDCIVAEKCSQPL
ncbi:hypothetical protein BDQ17DRAFT_1392082 [Cyathus striatus]|nr:hypothetical protein BDQ17DRAFT_1392082 [Cyathus striatus]